MCGIFTIINNKTTFNSDIIKESFDKGNNRGPEESKLIFNAESLVFGFKRLAINGLDKLSGQPMTIDKVTVLCNGEIYNFKELYNFMDIKPTTGSDCEVIIRMYQKYGFDYTVKMLDGVFSIILYDNSSLLDESQLFIARDPFGVRPLYMMEIINDETNECYVNNVQSNEEETYTNENIIAFASEVKSLSPLLNNQKLFFIKKNEDFDKTNFSLKNKKINKKGFYIHPFEPGSYSYYKKNFKVNSEWKAVFINKKYFITSTPSLSLRDFNPSNNIEYYENIVFYLEEAVKKRVLGTTERPIACLLSGGLDSSLITALVNKYYPGKLKTFSIGMSGSDDLKYAKIVSEYLKTEHTEIILTPDQFFDAIPEVIKAIESYDTTTVRASVGNYLIGKYISKNTDLKVVFNGDGSDELTGGYLYFLKSPTDMDFDKECKRLLNNIHTFDVLRSDRCISSHGLEPRTPFLDKTFVNYYLSIPIKHRNPLSSSKPCEKKLLREAFSFVYKDLLPQNILWRTKEAFSDGVSGDNGSWFQIIKDKLDNNKKYINNTTFICKSEWNNHNKPTTDEQKYYRNLYELYYPNTSNNIPYFWMPKFIEAYDSSARTLSIYNEINKNILIK
tara:strand:+ start:6185 stop:8032 length:1848 start_codon:yes stop_codon:yes gene_type:complete